MGKLILYGSIGSPPVRTALLTLSALELDYELKNVDMQNGENRSEEYLKKNPQHTVPVLDDDGQYIWDSHAISAYLVRKYGKTDALYPKDPYQRAVVDQRLHFDSGVLFARALKGFMSPNLDKEEKIANILEAYGFLEAFLDSSYLAGDQLTIADLSALATVSTLDIMVPIDAEKTPKLITWWDLLKQLPYYEEINGKGIEAVAGMIKPMLAAAASVPDTEPVPAVAPAVASAVATDTDSVPASAASDAEDEPKEENEP